MPPTIAATNTAALASPPRLRATGSGFTYNIGRIIAAGGPFVVGSVAVELQHHHLSRAF